MLSCLSGVRREAELVFLKYRTSGTEILGPLHSEAVWLFCICMYQCLKMVHTSGSSITRKSWTFCIYVAELTCAGSMSEIFRCLVTWLGLMDV